MIEDAAGCLTILAHGYNGCRRTDMYIHVLINYREEEALLCLHRLF